MVRHYQWLVVLVVSLAALCSACRDSDTELGERLVRPSSGGSVDPADGEAPSNAGGVDNVGPARDVAATGNAPTELGRPLSLPRVVVPTTTASPASPAAAECGMPGGSCAAAPGEGASVCGMPGSGCEDAFADDVTSPTTCAVVGSNDCGFAPTEEPAAVTDDPPVATAGNLDEPSQIGDDQNADDQNAGP